MMVRARDLVGYTLGFVLFVVLMPALMWRVSGAVKLVPVRMAVCGLMGAAGIGLSVWSIVHMRLVGKGNPMDAFNHEVAPRTSELMTDGPYALCRNPMLLGVLIYYAGVLVLLASPGALLVFVVYALIMAVQVSREEQRLERDFGEAYLAYKRQTKRLIPFVW